MLAILFALAVLFSVVLLPLILRAGGRSISDLFTPPSQGTMRWLFYIVIALQAIAAVAQLIAKPLILNEPVILWAGMLYVAYVWLEAALLLVSDHHARQSAEVEPAESA